jgi:uncharacterized membrane protein (DUF4010 family)
VTALVLVEKGGCTPRSSACARGTAGAALRGAGAGHPAAAAQGPFGPASGSSPREIWILVLVFSGLSFAGYVALRAAGPERGLGLAGLLGGIVSSTAVTLNFSRESRRQPEVGGALALGILAASTVMPLRVAIVAAVLNRELAWRAAPLLAVPFVLGIVLVAPAWRGRESGGTAAPPPGNPLASRRAADGRRLPVVLYAMERTSGWLGNSGVLATSAVTGLADLDALTYSLSRLSGAGATVEAAARGLVSASSRTRLSSSGWRWFSASVAVAGSPAAGSNPRPGDGSHAAAALSAEGADRGMAKGPERRLAARRAGREIRHGGRSVHGRGAQ